MKVLIAYPPLNYPMYPYPATYILAGILKNIGVEFDVLDLNVEFLKYFLSSKNLKNSRKKIINIYKNKNLPVEHKSYLKKILFKYKKITNKVIKEGDTYYDLFVSESPSISKIRRINYALKLAFAPYYPLVINAKGVFLLEEHPTFKFNYDDLLARTNDNVDNPYVDFYQHIIKKKNIKKYDLVALTIPFDTNLYPALTFSRLVKEKTNCNVIIGGALINSTISSYIRYPDLFNTYFDAILTGNGEVNIPQYIEYLKKKITINEVNGAVYRKNNVICQNSPASITNKNQLKPPCFKAINFKDYHFRRINLEFSKGCYWGKCVYCSSVQKRYHVIDVIDAVNIIENAIKETGIKNFAVLDDAVNINFAENFADEILKRNLKIEYHLYLRLEKELNKSLFLKLYSSGLRSVFFGLESASERILNLMNKGIDIKEAQRILKDSSSSGIVNIVSFVFGFPFETEEDLLKTIKFQKENKEYIACTNNFCFTLLKGAKFLQNKFNITNIKDVEEFSNYLTFEAQCIAKEKLKQILKENNLSSTEIFTRW